MLRGRPEPRPERLTVMVGGESLPVVVRRREAARRLTLRVSGATREIVLTLPKQASLPSVEAFLKAHAGWVAARLARLHDGVAFTPGTTIPLRGEPHRIEHERGSRGATRVLTDAKGEGVISVGGEPDAVPGRVRRFLRTEAEADLRAAVARYAGRIGMSYGRVSVRDTRSRWGSCSSTGALSFSWRLILAPRFVLDYLAAHEVAHLRELNHSPRFWALVHELCPETERAETWLKRHGTELHRYGEA